MSRKRTAPGVQTGGGGEISGASVLGVDRSGPILVSSASSEVSWSHAHAELWPIVARSLRQGPLPLVGTHEWLELSASDPRRVGAIYLAAELWALTAEVEQTATAEASRSVAAGTDWARTARDLADLAQFRRENPWATRVAT